MESARELCIYARVVDVSEIDECGVKYCANDKIWHHIFKFNLNL